MLRCDEDGFVRKFAPSLRKAAVEGRISQAQYRAAVDRIFQGLTRDE